jgi:hypothetical protein
MPTTELAPRAPRMAMGSLEDPKELGTMLAASGYFSDAREAAQAVVKVLAGAELGFGPIASMTGVYIVKGRVTLSANLMAAAIKRHPKYDYRVRDISDTKAEVVFMERTADGWTEAGSSEFTMDDARRAGLAGGENWKKYPRNMLLWRAMSNGAKFFCPDAFAGAPVYTPDELGAEVDPESGEIIEGSFAAYDAPPAPMPKARRRHPARRSRSPRPSSRNRPTPERADAETSHGVGRPRHPPCKPPWRPNPSKTRLRSKTQTGWSRRRSRQVDRVSRQAQRARVVYHDGAHGPRRGRPRVVVGRPSARNHGVGQGPFGVVEGADMTDDQGEGATRA